jgi:gluconolactonase
MRLVVRWKLAALVLLSPVMVAVAFPADEKARDAGAKVEETVDVKLKDLELRLPKSWSQSDVVNNMRLGTFEVPPVDGDRDKGELTVSSFPGGGGSVEDNLKRWIGQFEAEGRESVVRMGKAGENAYHIAEISGTYLKPVGPPIQRKTEPVAGYRMLAVILNLNDKEVYFLKLTGPDATVKAQSEALRSAFGAKSEGEKDYEI